MPGCRARMGLGCFGDSAGASGGEMLAVCAGAEGARAPQVCAGSGGWVKLKCPGLGEA